MIKTIFVAIVLLLGGCAGADHAQGSGTVLLVLGDSLSAGHGLSDPDQEGWVGLMELAMRTDGFLGQDQAVVNASVSGLDSEGGLALLPDLLEAHNPRVVLIELGANDTLRRQSMAALASNLGQMVTLAEQSGARVVLVDVDMPLLAQFMGGGALGETIEGVAQERDLDVIVLPLSQLMDDGLVQDDRLHPTAQAQLTIQSDMEPALRRILAAD